MSFLVQPTEPVETRIARAVHARWARQVRYEKGRVEKWSEAYPDYRYAWSCQMARYIATGDWEPFPSKHYAELQDDLKAYADLRMKEMGIVRES